MLNNQLIPSSSLKTRQLFGWKILAEKKAEFWSELVAKLTHPTAKLVTIFTPNPEIVMLSQADQIFHQTVAQADYLIPDGVGLVWAARRLSGNGEQLIPERIAGTDLVTELIQLAASHNWSSLIIGGRNYGSSLNKLVGQVNWISGFADVQHPTDIETDQILSALHRLKPKLVFVALGAPFQETWIVAHQSDLVAAGVKLAMSVGGAFDFLLGKVARAPAWARNLGLEWLFRLLIQPWRLNRQLALIKFWWLVQFGRTKTI